LVSIAQLCFRNAVDDPVSNECSASSEGKYREQISATTYPFAMSLRRVRVRVEGMGGWRGSRGSGVDRRVAARRGGQSRFVPRTTREPFRD
jgi:hypothetical protein